MTEYAECPQCGDDGPHAVEDDRHLECGRCYCLFPNPFADTDPVVELGPE